MPESKIKNTIKELIKQSLTDQNFPVIPAQIHLERPTRTEFGDFSSNVAMTLEPSESLKSKLPREVAEALATVLQTAIHQNPTLGLEKVEVAGPGFINFFVSEHFLMTEIGLISQSRTPAVLKLNEPKTAVVEYSSPNIAKPFTVGHLRSTIIGDAVANLLEVSGYQVFRDNHVGDWGTQFGKLIQAIKLWGSEAEIAQAERPIKKLVELYIKFHEAAEQDPSLDDQARAWFTKLEQGDAEARRLWQLCIDWSWQEFEQVYQRLNIQFTENNGRGYGESFFEDKMAEVIDELKAKNLLTESEGAQLVFFPDNVCPPLMILKKDGSTLYATRDLATDKFRLKKYGNQAVIINEVGAEQSLYFEQVYRLEALLGWYQPGQRVHVKHGLYRLKDSKMSTRKGNVIWLEDILQAAYDAVVALAQAESKLSPAEIWKIAVAAVKWHDLKRESQRDIVFNLAEMVSLQGNTGPYVQYVYVRCHSLLAKAEQAGVRILSDFDTSLYSYTQKERAVASLLIQFGDVVWQAAENYQPHHVCTYLNQLAQAFNAMYAEAAIVAETNLAAQQARLNLVASCLVTLQLSLDLIGIDTVEKM